jgi:uncharacterized protein YuzB (UPF0349 family)
VILEVLLVGLIRRLFSKTKPIDIQFCTKNLDRHLTDEAQEKLMELSTQGKINIKEYECLSHCEQCKETFYALVEGKFIAGEPLEVIQEIRKKRND